MTLYEIENYFNERDDQMSALCDELEHGEFSLVLETPSLTLAFGDCLVWKPETEEI